jgi:hypothetical protein
LLQTTKGGLLKANKIGKTSKDARPILAIAYLQTRFGL